MPSKHLLFIIVAFMAIAATETSNDVIPISSPAPLATPQQNSNDDGNTAASGVIVDTLSRWKRNVDTRASDISKTNTSLLFFTLFVFFVLILMVICFCTGFYVGSATSRQATELRNTIQTNARYIQNVKLEPPTSSTAIDDEQHQLLPIRTRSKSNEDNHNDKRRRRLDELQVYDVRANQ